MQLTLINFFKRTVPGHIFRGKRRLVRKVTEKEMNRLLNHYKVQENNMLYLKNPYITLVSSIIVVNWICHAYVNQQLQLTRPPTWISQHPNRCKC